MPLAGAGSALGGPRGGLGGFLLLPGLTASLASACCPGLSDPSPPAHTAIFQEYLLGRIAGDSDGDRVMMTKLGKWPGSQLTWSRHEVAELRPRCPAPSHVGSAGQHLPRAGRAAFPGAAPGNSLGLPFLAWTLPALLLPQGHVPPGLGDSLPAKMLVSWERTGVQWTLTLRAPGDPLRGQGGPDTSSA